MKTIKFYLSLFLISTLFINAINTDPEVQKEQTANFKVNKGGKLSVNVGQGDIKIRTWDKSEVVVKVKGLEDEDAGNLNMWSEKNTVKVTYYGDWGSDIEFIINIPSAFDIDLNTKSGDITITGDVYGDAEIVTYGGDIQADNIKGKTNLDTKGGDIKVGNINGNLTLITMGGDVRVGDVNSGNAKVTTMGGDISIGKVASELTAISYGGDITASNIGGNADVKTMGGDIELGYVSGSAKMATNGGDLLLKSASGEVTARSNGGDIELKGVTGSINATTMGGNITAELNPSPKSNNEITTKGGEIEIIIPSNAQATIEATISWRGLKRQKSELKIYSDFEAKSYTTNKNKKEINATYVINSGGAKIYAKSVNDNITIKKSTK